MFYFSKRWARMMRTVVARPMPINTPATSPNGVQPKRASKKRPNNIPPTVVSATVVPISIENPMMLFIARL